MSNDHKTVHVVFGPPNGKDGAFLWIVAGCIVAYGVVLFCGLLYDKIAPKPTQPAHQTPKQKWVPETPAPVPAKGRPVGHVGPVGP